MRRIDFTELKRCVVCDRFMRRKRYGKARRLEKPAEYHKRQTCGLLRCRSVYAERKKAAAMRAIRPTPDMALLSAIAAENHLVVGHCSRCGDVFLATERQLKVAGRKRCDYCLRKGSAASVSYLRGPTRGSELRYMRALERELAKGMVTQ